MFHKVQNRLICIRVYSRNAWKQRACSDFLTSVTWHETISSWDHSFNQISPLELCHLVRSSSPVSSFHTHMTATEAVCIISPPRVGHVHSSDWKSPSSVSPQPQEDDAVNCPVTPLSHRKSWGRRSVGLDQRGWTATLNSESRDIGFYTRKVGSPPLFHKIAIRGHRWGSSG